MNEMIRFARIALGAALLNAAIAGTALAREKLGREPVRGNSQRETSMMVDRYDRPLVIERERSDFKTHATFSAEPQQIENNAILVFEIKSIGGDGELSRWSCVAVHNVAECLGNGVRVPYRPRDEKMILTITAKPSYTEESRAMIAEQSRMREEKLAAARAQPGPVATSARD